MGNWHKVKFMRWAEFFTELKSKESSLWGSQAVPEIRTLHLVSLLAVSLSTFDYLLIFLVPQLNSVHALLH